MTIRITIKNEGGAPQVIGIQDVHLGPNEPIPAKKLKGGESAEFTIWGTKQLVVFEINNG